MHENRHIKKKAITVMLISEKEDASQYSPSFIRLVRWTDEPNHYFWGISQAF